MKPLDIKVLVLSLKMSTIITKLDLSGNGFGSMGAIYLAKFMKYNEYVTELNLSDNDIGQKGSLL
jgi:Ran GTPase-activating protein (RanGAP) involved in mRNA processing and transport